MHALETVINVCHFRAEICVLHEIIKQTNILSLFEIRGDEGFLVRIVATRYSQIRAANYACIQPPAAHTCRPTCHLPHHRKCLQKACARYRYYFINSLINFAAGIIFERA